MSFDHPFKTRWLRSKPHPLKISAIVDKYFISRPKRTCDPKYHIALKRAAQMFSLPTPIKPMHVNDVIRHYPHPDRSPGLPYTKQGFRRKDEIDPLKIKMIVHHLKYGTWSKCKTPCNAVAKTAVHPTEEKLRLIWVYPAHMTFAEGMFAMPLIHAFQQRGIRQNYGISIQYRIGHMRYMQQQKPKGYTWFACDWKAFDQGPPPWLIRDAFDILRKLLDFSAYQFRGTPTDKESLPRLWNAIINYFINTPIKDTDGKIRVKSGGIPSGSYFTNLIDSIINAIVLIFLFEKFAVIYYDGAFWVYGDDGIIAVKGTFDLKEMAAMAKEVFGMELNMEKTEITEFPKFLGFKFTTTGTPSADYERLMAQLVLPSRPDRNQTEFCSRIRALQLASLGGSRPFIYQTQLYLESVNILDPPMPHRRDEAYVKLEALGLEHWPPLAHILRI
nr:RNA-dependent RNA polymerase [Partitiviridae sp.]